MREIDSPGIEHEGRIIRDIGRYTPTGFIKFGGFSQVVLARASCENVAIKLFNRKEGSTERFKREVAAHSIAQEVMSNAVPLLDHGVMHLDEETSPEGVPYIVMGLADGTLKEIVTFAGPLPAGDAVEVIDIVAEGLDALHEVNIVHCDIKPENVLFLRKGEEQILWVADFGAAVRKGERNDTYSPSYAAPEVLQRGEVSEATDVYGLGGMFVTVVNGEPLFPEYPISYRSMILSKDYPSLMAARVHEKISPELQSAVKRALHPDPDQRFTSAGSFARTLIEERLMSSVYVGVPAVIYDLGRERKVFDKISPYNHTIAA